MGQQVSVLFEQSKEQFEDGKEGVRRTMIRRELPSRSRLGYSPFDVYNVYMFLCTIHFVSGRHYIYYISYIFGDGPTCPTPSPSSTGTSGSPVGERLLGGNHMLRPSANLSGIAGERRGEERKRVRYREEEEAGHRGGASSDSA
jgi:hypothetical protein